MIATMRHQQLLESWKYKLSILLFRQSIVSIVSTYVPFPVGFLQDQKNVIMFCRLHKKIVLLTSTCTNVVE